eukprot:gene24415-10016_t
MRMKLIFLAGRAQVRTNVPAFSVLRQYSKFRFPFDILFLEEVKPLAADTFLSPILLHRRLHVFASSIIMNSARGRINLTTSSTACDPVDVLRFTKIDSFTAKICASVKAVVPEPGAFTLTYVTGAGVTSQLLFQELFDIVQHLLSGSANVTEFKDQFGFDLDLRDDSWKISLVVGFPKTSMLLDDITPSNVSDIEIMSILVRNISYKGSVSSKVSSGSLSSRLSNLNSKLNVREKWEAYSTALSYHNRMHPDQLAVGDDIPLSDGNVMKGQIRNRSSCGASELAVFRSWTDAARQTWEDGVMNPELEGLEVGQHILSKAEVQEKKAELQEKRAVSSIEKADKFDSRVMASMWRSMQQKPM